MRILEDMADKYRKLFNETGLIKFFMYAKNIERLNNDIMGVEQQQESKNEDTLEV